MKKNILALIAFAIFAITSAHAQFSIKLPPSASALGLCIGEVVAFKWTSTLPSNTVVHIYIADARMAGPVENAVEIGTTTTGAGKLNWKVTDDVSLLIGGYNCYELVLVTDSFDFGFSDTFFSITYDPHIKATTPNGINLGDASEVWNAGEVHSLQFFYVPLNTVQKQVSVRLINVQTHTMTMLGLLTVKLKGTYNVPITVPSNVPSGFYRLKITEQVGPYQNYDLSGEFFLQAPPVNSFTGTDAS